MSQDEKFIVKYKQKSYDITNFVAKHPGGINTLKNFEDAPIDQSFKKFEHSDAAEYILNQYKICEPFENELEVRNVFNI